MTRPRSLVNIPPLRSLLQVPEELLPPPGFDVAPHREGVRLAREAGALFFVFRMTEFRSEDGPCPDALMLCGSCAKAHHVSILELDLKYLERKS